MVPISINISFASFLNKFSISKEEHKEKVLETFGKIQINIPHLVAIKQVPWDVKFLKEFKGSEVVREGRSTQMSTREVEVDDIVVKIMKPQISLLVKVVHYVHLSILNHFGWKKEFENDFNQRVFWETIQQKRFDFSFLFPFSLFTFFFLSFISLFTSVFLMHVLG